MAGYSSTIILLLGLGKNNLFIVSKASFAIPYHNNFDLQQQIAVNGLLPQLCTEDLKQY